MPLTRRQFLKRATVATAGAVAAPSFFSNPFVRRAMAETIGNKYLIVLFLDGGNDGLNTVVPAGNAVGNLRDAYEAARGTGGGGLRLSSGALLPIADDPNSGTPLGLHPGLQGLANLYDTHGNVAVVQGCGYPEYSLSHEESRYIWQLGSRFAPQTNGWVGRHLMDEYGLFDVPAICVRNTIPPDFRQTGTNVLAINRLSSFRFPYDTAHNSDSSAKATAFSAIHAAATGSTNALTQTMGAVGNITLQSTTNYQSLHADWNSARSAAIQTAYTDSINSYGSGIATRLREVSKMIYGVETGKPGVDCHFFNLDNGGYDTHSDQGTDGANEQHYSLHRELGDAVEVFYNDMIDLGAEDRVCIVVWSEFSRRVVQNSNGTDHGSQGPMFVIGGTVNGGVYGNHPDIRPASLDNNGNSVYSQGATPYASTDFRDVFGTILQHWVGMNLADVQSLLPVDTVGDPDEYWHAADFSMGFLP